MPTEPWLAVTLSTMLPGAGHIYVRKPVIGMAILVAFLASTVVAICFLYRTDGDMRLSLTAGICSIALWIVGSFHSFHVSKKNNPSEWEALRKSTKDPWLALLLSRVFPPLGHIYLRQWRRALGVVAAMFLAGIVLVSFIVLLQAELPTQSVARIATDIFVGIATGVIGSIVYFSAPVRREPNLKSVVILQSISTVWFTVLLLTIGYVRENVVEPFYIYGRSMAPTINAGDRILVSKCEAKMLKRGDLGIFIPPNTDPSVKYVKRLVAIGGETVEIRADGRVYVDDSVLNDPPFDQLRYIPLSGEFGERLTSYSYTVPSGSYFFLGDNSTLSKDCRYYGAIPARDIVGFAYKIWWPLDHAKALAR